VWQHGRKRIVAAEAHVIIDGARYSVPAHLVGTPVTVREHAADCTIWAGDTQVARHPRQPRHTLRDRPLHHASTVSIKGDSVRLREKRKAGLVRAARAPQAGTLASPGGDVQAISLGDHHAIIDT
jgi:hypothetical protein